MCEELGFRAKLKARQEKVNSLVCVGLDPLPEKLPECVGRETTNPMPDKIAWWMEGIVDATAKYASMYKPQLAHWEALVGRYEEAGCGQKALQCVIRYIHEKYPDIPVFLDRKCGDIDATQARYRVSSFDSLGADGVNFSPYMGKSCMAALVDKKHPGRALVGLCYTSNPSAREVQDVFLANGRPYWHQMAKWILQWAYELEVQENAGLVMAAAFGLKESDIVYSGHLKEGRRLVGSRLWFLVPGVGTQGGFVKETVGAGFAGYGSMAINSSSDICFASSGEDFAEAAGKKAEALRDLIREAMPTL